MHAIRFGSYTVLYTTGYVRLLVIIIHGMVSLAFFEDNQVEENVSSAALRCLHTPAARCAYDTSSMGRGADVDQNKNYDDDNDDDDYNNNGSRSTVAPFPSQSNLQLP